MVRKVVGVIVIAFLVLCFVNIGHSVEPCVSFSRSLTSEEHTTIHHRAASFQGFNKEMKERNMRRVISAELYENSGYMHEIWVTRSGAVQWLEAYRDMHKNRMCITSEPRSFASMEVNLDGRVGLLLRGRPDLRNTGELSGDKFAWFELFSNCQPMELSVYIQDGEEIGLAKSSVQAAAESRLRSARLYRNSNTTPFLSVTIRVYRLAFSINVQYHKRVFDYQSGLSFGTVTWERDTLGSHGGKSAFILSSVSELLDNFLVEYLRVNHKACETR